jgi:putative addiction module killer protein
VEATPRILEIYVTEDGREPFTEWLTDLRDRMARAKIRTRLDRVRLGNLDDCASVGDGLYELRVAHGAGYRVYLGLLGPTGVVLLCGGDKTTQVDDIQRAKRYWKDFKRRSDHANQ